MQHELKLFADRTTFVKTAKLDNQPVATSLSVSVVTPVVRRPLQQTGVSTWSHLGRPP